MTKTAFNTVARFPWLCGAKVNSTWQLEDGASVPAHVVELTVQLGVCGPARDACANFKGTIDVLVSVTCRDFEDPITTVPKSGAETCYPRRAD